jgi:hypothetical protein
LDEACDFFESFGVSWYEDQFQRREAIRKFHEGIETELVLGGLGATAQPNEGVVLGLMGGVCFFGGQSEFTTTAYYFWVQAIVICPIKFDVAGYFDLVGWNTEFNESISIGYALGTDPSYLRDDGSNDFSEALISVE